MVVSDSRPCMGVLAVLSHHFLSNYTRTLSSFNVYGDTEVLIALSHYLSAS